uniref:Uncharacterized protein n=1 Tax=Cucumis melo TaxID=3656 RepID=A0A9I9EEV1_CUCME
MNLINHQAKIKLTSIEATKQACDSQSCLQSEPPKAMGKQSNNQPKLQTLGHQYRDLYSSSCVLMKNE